MNAIIGTDAALERPSISADDEESIASRHGTEMTPLVVDLDGTLLATDTLVESVLKLVKKQPGVLLKLPFWLLRGRAAFKTQIARRVELDVAHLPWRQPLVDYLHEQRRLGRKLILATAAHCRIADQAARHLGVFDQVLASSSRVNLKGSEKLRLIQQEVGENFCYAGNDSADLEIWRHASAAITAGAAPARYPELPVKIERAFPDPTRSMSTWLRALRAHQWVKNVLIFVPLLTSFSFMDLTSTRHSFLAFISFCLAASATYILNDLWDLENDRRHPRKQHRPLASSLIPIPQAMLAAGAALLTALLIAYHVGMMFVVLLLSYVLITTVYSLFLKQVVLVDVMVLAILYTLRVLAGAVALGVHTSTWLLAFSIFLFFSLALVKRCSELQPIQGTNRSAHGRDYRSSDLAVLWPLGTASGLCAVIVFGLFITTLTTEQRYATPELLWLAGLGLLYWIARLWIKTNRGEMHDDPVVFALKDRSSLLAVAGMVGVTVVAYFLEFTLT